MWGSSALFLLWKLKLRGMLRRQWRRLRTPKGLLLGILGVLLFVLWFGSIAMYLGRESPPLLPEEAEPRVRLAAALLVLLSISSALVHRGLFLPKNEIERMFSSPVSRADLVRYRLLSAGLRSLPGGVILGLYGQQRMPSKISAFLGIALALQTLPVLNQLLALALGGLERRAGRFLRRVGGLLLVALLLVLGGALVAVLLPGRGPAELPLVGPWLEALTARGQDPLAHPALARATLPLQPWARAITAESLPAALPWFALCTGILLALAELCARIPIDFRELSLATSERMAARIARARRGGGAAAASASRDAARWRVPWAFGRTPMGAVAWRKSAGLLRKARSAFWVAVLALGFISLLSAQLFHGQPEERALGAPILIAMLGTFYLCSGLRFDFREDLERMDVIKSWPVAAWRIFLGMLLPEVAVVSLLLITTVLAIAFLSGSVPLIVPGVAVALPGLVLAWVALDNAVFLVAPVRLIPGQEGMLQNAGRGFVLLFVRSLLVLLLTLVVGAPTLLVWFVVIRLGASDAMAQGVAYAAALVALATADAALVFLGGQALRRFDVARDRG